MNRLVDMTEFQAEMIRVCIDQNEAKKKQKDFEKICQVFIKQINNVDRQNNKKQCPIIQINAFPPASNKLAETNQSFIFTCLLYLFVKLKSLKVQITERATQRGKDNQNSIGLVLGGQKEIACGSQFERKLCELYQERGYDYVGKQNHFNQLSFRCLCEEVVQSKSKSKSNVKIRWECQKFISSFYEKVDVFFINKPVYLLKNSLIFVEKEARSSKSEAEKLVDTSHSIRMIRALKKIYSRILILKGLPSDSLAEFAVPDHSINEQIQTLQNVNQESSHQQLGIFKQFQGKPLQYLEHLAIGMGDIQKQFRHIKSMLRVTPNLAIIEIGYPTVFTVSHIDPFLEAVAKRTPLMKKIIMKNLRVANISPTVLEQLYNQCPFLIELSIGLRFAYSILDTFEYRSPQEKDLKERDRTIQILLQALRLRNITLNNNIEMTKLLLKKQYSFISALQIVDCIEPICF